jgi:glycosyltransferase involved in cell wall biosynthesis
MQQRPRILLLIPHLGGGGAERVIALLACGLSREKYEIHLGLVTQSQTLVETLPEWVTVHPLGASRVRYGVLPILRLVRRLRPSAILSGIAHLNFLVLLLRPFFPRGTRVLVRQNGTVSSALAFGGLPWYTRTLYRLLYRHADCVICQSQAMASDLAAELSLDSERITVLPNPLDIDRIKAASDAPSLWTGPGPHLLAVGRLSREKGFDLLLLALAYVRRHLPKADLVVAGAGPEEAALRTQCCGLGMNDAVRFVGYIERPYLYYPGADVFVLSSRHEGMPNALLEALAGGLPIVALPASGGIQELLRWEQGAWVAPSISAEALAYQLCAALKGLRASQRFQRPFCSPATAVDPPHTCRLPETVEKN